MAKSRNDDKTVDLAPSADADARQQTEPAVTAPLLAGVPENATAKLEATAADATAVLAAAAPGGTIEWAEAAPPAAAGAPLPATELLLSPSSPSSKGATELQPDLSDQTIDLRPGFLRLQSARRPPC